MSDEKMSGAQSDPTQRFTDLVSRYVKYRPGYPPQVYGYLLQSAGLSPDALILDLGSGTGLLSEVFLRRGHALIGLEPNKSMRLAGEEHLSSFDKFTSLAGIAEDIPLEENSVDFATAGQAFHWFQPAETKVELQRVLRPGGRVALIWNDRDLENSAFQADYHQLLLKFGTDYQRVSHQESEAQQRIETFFSPHKPRVTHFANQQVFDWEGLKGRFLSSSYSPQSDHPEHEPALLALEQLFRIHHINGRLVFRYRTTILSAPIH